MEKYLCIDEFGKQYIVEQNSNDYFTNYNNYAVMIKLQEDIIQELLKEGE